MSFKNTFPCNTCNLVFTDSQAQRAHMHEPWHVHNLRRRMAELPPVTADVYSHDVAISDKHKTLRVASSSAITRPQMHAHEALDNDQAEVVHCLFCTKELSSIEANLEHMFVAHSLYIPEIERLSDLETLLRYLCDVITEYKECLYCGTCKESAEAVQRHMLDKGHCMINLEREPELLEFWDLSDAEDDVFDEDAQPRASIAALSASLTEGEHALPSGKVVRTKNSAREARLLTRRLAAKEMSSQDDSVRSHAVEKLVRSQAAGTDCTVARRDAMGLIGISDLQMRSLSTMEKNMQRQQAVVQASRVWADEKGGVHQKHYKTKMNLRDG